MFACLYFERDATLSVVHKNDKDLKILGTFESGQAVEMQWRVPPSKSKEIFNGVLVKVGNNEESLTKFATSAYNALLKGKVLPGTSAPEKLFSFDDTTKPSGKRERIPTKKLAESKQQDVELRTPKKKKKKGVKEGSLSTSETKHESEKLETKERSISSLFKQFRNSILDSSSEIINCDQSSIENSHEETMVPTINQHTSPQEASGSLYAAPLASSSGSTSLCTEQGTNLSTTWQACHGALKLLSRETCEDLNDNFEQTTSDGCNQLPVLSACVINTLRGLVQPEFINFIQNFCTHMESGSCSHTCLKSVLDKDIGEKLDTQGTLIRSQSLLAELYGTPGRNYDQIQQASQQPDSLQQPILQPDNSGGQQYAASSIDNIIQHHPNMPQQSSKQDCQDTEKVLPQPQRSSTQGVLEDFTELPPRRKSPRKQINFSPSPSPSTPDSADQVKLLQTSQLTVNRQKLRKACHTATKKKDNAAFHLMYGILGEVFTLHELANSRGLGIGKVKPGDESKPVLDKEKIAVLKDAGESILDTSAVSDDNALTEIEEDHETLENKQNAPENLDLPSTLTTIEMFDVFEKTDKNNNISEKQLFQKDLNITDKQPMSFVCLMCGKTFQMKCLLLSHLRKSHLLTNLCQLCYFNRKKVTRFKNQMHLRSHKLEEHTSEMVSCIYCKTLLCSEKLLRIHLKRMKCDRKKRKEHFVKKKKIECICGEWFEVGSHFFHHKKNCQRLQDLLEAVRDHDDEESSGEQDLYPCKWCGRYFKRPYLYVHQKAKHMKQASRLGM